MTPNERVRQVRRSKGLTQMEFSGQISISISYLAGIETGARRVNNRIMRLIANAFNVNEGWLRTGKGKMFNAGPNACIDDAISLFKTLSPYHKKCALKQIEALVDLEATLRPS